MEYGIFQLISFTTRKFEMVPNRTYRDVGALVALMDGKFNFGRCTSWPCLRLLVPEAVDLNSALRQINRW